MQFQIGCINMAQIPQNPSVGDSPVGEVVLVGVGVVSIIAVLSPVVIFVRMAVDLVECGKML